jgi:hypothetical protein
VWLFAFLLVTGAIPRAEAELPRLKVSDNGRFLVTESGSPFFWLGDTSWNLFQRTSLEDTPDQPAIERYFAARARQGFTVIQAVLLMGIKSNTYGHDPFTKGDSPRPKVEPGPDNDYWDVADRLIDLGEKYGLYMALLPVWLDSLSDKDPIVRDPQVAYRYGHFLGSRYRAKTHIIWILGGDPAGKNKDVDNLLRLAMTRALAEGIADGVNNIDRQDGQADYSTTLMSFHPKGGHHSSSERLHAEPWLDFNMIQTTTHFSVHNYATVRIDYGKMPAKPTLDAEVAYENSLSLRKEEPQDRRITPWDVRRAAYWAVFAGGFGHTYGHRSFIQWTRRGENTGRGGDVPWYEMLDAPGANQMHHLRALMESRPFLSRVPDQGLLAEDAGQSPEHTQATRGDGYALIYTPTGRRFTVKLGSISKAKVKAWWFDPRTGAAKSIGEFDSSEEREFVPPSGGPDNDWVLVLDDAARGFSAPGTQPRKQAAQHEQPAVEARQWSVFEIELTAQREFANPYTDVEVTAQFAGPGGVTYAVRGFWDGDRTFRVRFTPPTRGQWTYTIQSSPPDAGLTRTGAFEPAAPAKNSHGFLRRDARYPTSFVFDDGTRFFMWGTTYYHLLLNARAGNRWKEAIDGGVRYGMNKARFSLYPSPAKGGVGHYPISSPFVDKEMKQPDLDHWRAADGVVQYMAQREFLADIILFWTKPKGSEALRREDERYLRYALARYAAFPNVIWCMVNEWNYSEVPQDYWNHLGRLVRAEDPWSRDGDFLRALSIHQQTRPDWNFAKETWPSHAILQFGVRNRGTSVRIGDEWVQASQGNQRFQHGDEWGNHSIVRNWTGKHPVVNDEYGYIGEPQDVSEDKRPDGSFQRFTREKHRHTMWAIAVGGGYGAAGDKNDYDDGRPYFSTNWHDTAEYGDIQRLVTFFTTQGLEYWKMAPHNELLRSGTRAYVLAEPGRQYVIYAAAGGSFAVDLPAGQYLAHRFDPRTGEDTALPEVGGGATRTFTAPDGQDWVFSVVRTLRLTEARLVW